MGEKSRRGHRGPQELAPCVLQYRQGLGTGERGGAVAGGAGGRRAMRQVVVVAWNGSSRAKPGSIGRGGGGEEGTSAAFGSETGVRLGAGERLEGGILAEQNPGHGPHGGLWPRVPPHEIITIKHKTSVHERGRYHQLQNLRARRAGPPPT